jgi:cathepsin B
MRVAVLLSLALFASVVSATLYEQHQSIIEHVNRLNTTWTAGQNSRWSKMTSVTQIKRQLGALKTPDHLRLPLKYHNDLHMLTLPSEFDSRTNWPQCPSIGEIRDQSDCGSCWAFGAAEAATDRVCIGTNGAQNPHLSATDVLSCCWMCGNGCNGGYPASAWSYFQSTGIVTGGNYGDNTWCSAYPFPICDHHVQGKYQPCAATEFNTPTCPSSCDGNSTYKTPFGQDKHKFASSYSIAADQEQIKAEIYKNGPVEAAFTVYADFPNYKSGVYHYTTGDQLGGHAIKIFGWGTENGVDYWSVANSWNEDWGDNGIFKIQRGSDECGIEDEIVAGLYQA